MFLTAYQRDYMKDTIKREYEYAPGWCKKVNQMADNQIFAIFCKMTAEKRIKTEYPSEIESSEHQISIDEWLNKIV